MVLKNMTKENFVKFKNKKYEKRRKIEAYGVTGGGSLFKVGGRDQKLSYH